MPVKKTKAPSHVKDPDLLLIKMADLKARRDALDAEFREVQAELIGILDERNTKSITATSGGVKVTGTVVKSSVVNIMEDRLRKAVDTSTWNKITKRVIDKSKVEDAITRGLLDTQVVAQCSEEVQRAPYVRLNERKA